MSSTPKYRRVLLKVSGEALMGDAGFGIDVSTVDRIAADESPSSVERDVDPILDGAQ